MFVRKLLIACQPSSHVCVRIPNRTLTFHEMACKHSQIGMFTCQKWFWKPFPLEVVFYTISRALHKSSGCVCVPCDAFISISGALHRGQKLQRFLRIVGCLWPFQDPCVEARRSPTISLLSMETISLFGFWPLQSSQMSFGSVDDSYKRSLDASQTL